MSAPSKTALVTGINGFTGRYMRDELAAAGYRIVGLGANPSSDKNYWQVNLLDALRVKRALFDIQPDVVVHLAAIAFVGHGDTKAFHQINVLGTRNLLDAIVEMGKTPTCVLLASSANVYGNALVDLLSEDAQPSPANDYAISKLAMERMANPYHSLLPIVVTRPFNYTGVGQDQNFLIPKIVTHFRAGASVIELGNLDISRDFSDVRAVVQAYRGLLEVPAARGNIVNVCSGQAYSLREIIDFCKIITGRSIDVRVSPDFVRHNEVKSLRGDSTRLHSLIGDWNAGCLRQTLQWMLTSEQWK